MPKVKWNPEIFKRNKLVISPSQYDSFGGSCNREWWWERVRRMPGKPGGRQFIYGNVMHSVWERWLRANDQGRDEKGQIVDLYPKGWEWDEDKGRVSPAEAAQIRRLTDDAIARGVLRRLPNRKIEVPFDCQVIPGVAMIGVVDQLGLNIVEDHKSVKLKKYALTKAKLAKDPKMLCYAAWYFLTYQDAQVVTLRLNYACKDQTLKVPTWEVSADVTRAEVMHFWKNEACIEAQNMINLKGCNFQDEDWEKVDGPDSTSVCKKYGGCDYLAICSNQITPAAARAVGELRNKPKKKKGSAMGAFGKKKTAKKAAEKPVSDEPMFTKDMVETPEAPAVDAPPWAVATCNACQGTGINKEGTPCRACDVVSGRTGGRTVSEFQTWHADDGTLRWAEADGAAPVEGPEVAEKKKPTPKKASKAKKTTKKAAAKKAAPKASPAPEAKEDTVPAAEDPKTAEVTVVNVTNAPQTLSDAVPETVLLDLVYEAPSAGFTLYVGCLPLNEGSVSFLTIFHREAQELASAMGKDSYYNLPVFSQGDQKGRRDFLASCAESVATTLTGAIFVPPDLGPDAKAYLEAIQPFAGQVVVATA